MSTTMQRLLFSGIAAGFGLWAAATAVPARLFEPAPRVVAEGRDPVLSVRASGAVSLMSVDAKADLYVHTSFNNGDTFEPGVRVNDVPGEVSSHSESSPQMQIRTRSEFYVLWQTRRGDGEGSVLRFARSLNWGESFSKAIDIDPSSPSQSFYTMNVSPKGVVYAAWLDGRDRGKGRPGTSAVYLARSTNKGVSFEPPVRVSLDVCPCCRPNIAFTADGRMYVSWRGVLAGSVRDIFVAASADEGVTWSKGTRVAEDNWVLNGCPHSGASMSSIGKRLFIAWHAVRDKRATLAVSYSDDGGQSFTRRLAVSEGVLDPNHPFLESVGEGRLALVFQGRPAGEANGWAPMRVYYRELDSAGTLSPLQTVGQLTGSATYPVFAFEEPGRVYVAWTEPKGESKVVVMSRGRNAEN